MTRAKPTRWLVAGAVVAGGLLASAPPAAAHAVTGVKPTNYRSEIVGVSGGAVNVELLDLGRRIALVNPSRTDIVVLGYTGEPWLRVGARGVFENEYSYSAYTERQRRGSANGAPPEPSKASGPPRWRRTHGGDRLVWRDQRTRFEGPTPDAVRRARHEEHPVVPRWVVELRQGTTALTIEGRIRYVPPPSPLPWAFVAVTLFGAVALTLRSARWPVLVSHCLALLIAVDVVHSFANAAVSGGSLLTQAGNVLRASPLPFAAWIIGAASIPKLRQATDAGLIVAGSSALVIGFYGGVTDAAVLGASQVPTALSPFLARAAVSISLGLGFGIATTLAYEGMLGHRSHSPATVRG